MPVLRRARTAQQTEKPYTMVSKWLEPSKSTKMQNIEKDAAVPSIFYWTNEPAKYFNFVFHLNLLDLNLQETILNGNKTKV